MSSRRSVFFDGGPLAGGPGKSAPSFAWMGEGERSVPHGARCPAGARPQSAPVPAIEQDIAQGCQPNPIDMPSTQGGYQLPARTGSRPLKPRPSQTAPRHSVRTEAQRLSMHKQRQQHAAKQRVHDLHEYARAQHRQLVASVRLANDCCRVLKRQPAYSISNDPMKAGIFDLNTPSTLQMRVIAKQSGPPRFGWKSEGEGVRREISVPLFMKELDSLQRQAAAIEQRRRVASSVAELSPSRFATYIVRSSLRHSLTINVLVCNRISDGDTHGDMGDQHSSARSANNATRWQPQEVAFAFCHVRSEFDFPATPQSEEELREFIQNTVELASTLLEQANALGEKHSVSPYP